MPERVSIPPVMRHWLNGAAADTLRVVAGMLERLHLRMWGWIGWLDGGR